MGSVTATLLGAPGESTSIPAAKEGFAMYNQGHGRYALAISAWGSFIGSIIAVLLSLMLWPFIDKLFLLSYTEVRAVFFLALIGILIVHGQNSAWVNAILVAAGLALGSVGMSVDLRSTWGTFGNDYLAGGIPKITVVVFLFALPMILETWMQDPLRKIDMSNKARFSASEAMQKLPFGSILRGSTIGFFIGMIPSLSYIASSKFAWTIEKSFKKKSYQTGDAGCLAAAETANNAAVLTCLIPFLMFAVPITVSESLVADIISLTSSPFSPGWLYRDNNLLMILGSFFLANCVGFLLAYPLGQASVNMITKWHHIISPLAIMIMIAGVIQNAWAVNQVSYYLVIGAVMAIVGWVIRKHDLVPFIFTFLIANQVNLVWAIITQKYFY